MGLFAALFLGVILASTFFTGINIGVDATGKAALSQQLSNILVDITATRRYGSPLDSDDWRNAGDQAASVAGVSSTEIISRARTYVENGTSYQIVGISSESHVYDGLTVISGATALGENETYMWVDSQDANKLSVNDTVNFDFPLRVDHSKEVNLSLQLKVAGFVSLDDTAQALVSRHYRTSGISMTTYYENLLIVSWEETFAELLDAADALNTASTPFSSDILIFLNREAVINPWDMDASLETIRKIVLQINNKLASYDLTAYSDLQSALPRFRFYSLTMRFSFLVNAIPVFFIAWYVGTTVSDVSFNLRRREIGLLLAKGFSSGQMFRLFLSESLLIGVFGGLLGVGLSFLLSPFFITSVVSEFGGTTPVLTLDIVLLAVFFSIGITLLSTFKPSRRAAQMQTVDALKEYMYVEEVKPHRQRMPLLALFLGSYKIAMLIIGIPSLATYFMRGPLPTTNILLTILLVAWIALDGILTPFAPLLFLWGATKVLIRGSLAFQSLVAKSTKFLGDLSTLATKNVRRNPARTASIAFLIAMIIGYSFQTVGTLASEEDYIIRQVKTSVGADISISSTSLVNISEVIGEVAGLQGIASQTLEYSCSGQSISQTVDLVAIQPQEWLSTAYYENEWFTGNDVATAFQQMEADNNTIILQRSIASNLDLEVGHFIAMRFGFTTKSLRVVGFFGSEISRRFSPILNTGEFAPSSYWSYIPAGLYHSIASSVSASGRILVCLEANVDGAVVADQIRELDEVSQVYSVAEQLEERESNLLLTGPTNIQRIGVIFSVIAASLATALVAAVGLQERKKEVSIMSIRGLSFKQLTAILLAESLAVIAFAVALGVTVGLIIVHGNITALNAEYSAFLVRRMVFPPDAVIILVSSIILVFVSSVIPVIGITRKYISKLDRIVRA